MSEFKGTKGKWLYDHAQEAILSENLYIIADIFPPHNRENALLISKAPEMLEMLGTVIKDYENIIPQSPARDNRMQQIKELIKSATEI